MPDNENISYTSNHAYSKPGRAKPNWDQDLHELIDELDVDIMLRGVDSEKAEYDATDGALYLATDTENLYLGTGNQWERLDSTGGNPSFGHATADRVTINDAPASDTDAVRKQELDAVSETAESHTHSGDTLDPAEISIGDQNPDSEDYPIAALSVAGVTFWVGDEETAEMAETDVFIDVS